MRKLFFLLVTVFFATSVWTQQRTIRGKVIDNNNNPLAGVTVAVKGQNISVATDANGDYSINVPAGATLQFSMIGFASREIRVQNENNVSVTLQQQAAEMGEVVVTALGQSRRKDKLGYSASSFKAEEVNRTAPISPLDGLQGRVAGADISTVGGQPGSSGKVILRGYSSISGSNQALVVVDGVPITNQRPGSYDPSSPYRTDPAFGNGLDFGNGLNDLNPGDIENITLLKGAAATSLYGSRAASGVILITTRKGKAGKIKVDFASSAITSVVGKLPDFQNSFGQGWNGQHLKEENGSWGPRLDGQDRLWGSEVDNSRLIKPFSAIKDNVRHFFDQGLELSNNIAVSGGTANSNFYLSYGNVNSNGVLPGKTDFYGRNTISARGQVSSDKFLASGSLNYINRSGSNASTNDDEAGSSTFENIIQIARDINIVDFKDYNNKFFDVDNYFTPYAANPYFSLFENGNKYQSDRFFGNAELGFNFSKKVNIRWRTGLDVTNSRLKLWQAVERPQSGTWRGPNPTNYEGASYTAKVGSVTERSDYLREINSDLFINYNEDITSNLNLSGFVGANYNEFENRTQSTRVTDLTIPDFYSISNSANTPTVLAVHSKKRLMGAFAQVNLSFKDYLFLTMNARNDWSSTLPVESNSFFYPGVNASVIMNRLIDLDNSPVSYWKIRAGIGKTGRDAPVYSLASILTRGDADLTWGNIVFPLNGVPSYGLGNTIGNRTLRPEITTEIELGTEVRFLKDRIGLDVSVYKKRSDGQIINVPIASTSGYRFLTTNFGLVENKGIEIELNASPVKSKDFNWRMTWTFSKNINKVLELPEGLDKVDLATYFDVKMVARVGQPVGIFEAIKPEMTEDGKYITANGFYVATTTDEPYGNIARDFLMGLNNSVSYKNWTLGFTLDYRKGGYFVSRTADLTYFVGNAWLTQYNDRRPFIIPNSVERVYDANGNPVIGPDGKGVYTENTIPIDITNMNSYFYHSSNKAIHWDRIILPKTFLKLREITIGYNLPQNWVKRIKAENAKLTLVGRNFLLWVPQKNMFIDPEISDLGNDLLSEFGEQAAAPSIKSYGVSLRITF